MLFFHKEIIDASHCSYYSTISSYFDFPHSIFRPNFSKLLESSPFLQLVWFHTFSLILQNHPDLTLQNYLYSWCPLFRVMIKSLLLVTHSHPLASWDSLAHTCPSGKGLSMRSWSSSAMSHLFPPMQGPLHCFSKSDCVRTCLCPCPCHTLLRPLWQHS